MTKLTSLAMIVSLVLVMNEIYSSEAFGGRLGLYSKLRMRQGKRSPIDDEYEAMNQCIMSCVKCSGADLDSNDETVCKSLNHYIFADQNLMVICFLKGSIPVTQSGMRQRVSHSIRHQGVCGGARQEQALWQDVHQMLLGGLFLAQCGVDSSIEYFIITNFFFKA